MNQTYLSAPGGGLFTIGVVVRHGKCKSALKLKRRILWHSLHDAENKRSSPGGGAWEKLGCSAVGKRVSTAIHAISIQMQANNIGYIRTGTDSQRRIPP